MISAISNVSFKGDAPATEAVGQNYNDLINSPGKYSANAQEQKAPQGDQVDLSTKKEKSHKTGIIIGSVIGALALAWIGLGIAVGKGKLVKIEGADLKFGDKCKNFFHTIGNSAKKSYDSTLGKWFGKKADDAAAVVTEGAEGATKPGAGVGA